MNEVNGREIVTNNLIDNKQRFRANEPRTVKTDNRSDRIKRKLVQ